MHADGEIWLQTLWDIRKALGSSASEAIITQAMRLSPAEPSFLDERNAIIQADQALNGGANRDTLWPIFADRGMGYFAGTYDGGDVSPTADGSLPPAPTAPRGTISGRVTDADGGGALSGVTVGVAGLMNGIDKLTATTGADGRYTIAGVPESQYPRLIFTRNGYDPLSRQVTVWGGVKTERNAILRRDWASAKGGATALSNFREYQDLGCGPEAAMDQALAIGWSTDAPGVGAPNPSMIVRLPQAVNVASFGMDPGNTCTDGPLSGTTLARVETTTNFPCTDASIWTTQRNNEVFGQPQFGILTELPPTAGANGVRCVRLTLLQGNGGRFRDFSELGVYSTALPAQPTDPVPTPTPTPTPTSTPTPTPAPTATAVPSFSPTPTPTPTPAPVGKVTFKLPTKGFKGSAALRVSCPATCTARVTLTADKATAKKLKLRTLGTGAKAGKGGLSFTVKLSSKARKALKKRHLKSVTVTLKLSVTMDGATTTSTKRVKIRL